MKKLEKTINTLLKEYTGTGASGGNAGDGNIMFSPRPYHSDAQEVEKAYTNKNVYGAEGGHYKNYLAKSSMGIERQKMGMFELKDFIKKIVQEIEVEEQAYPNATLTTQGQSIHRAPGIWEEDIQEQLSQSDMSRFNNKKIRHQKAIAQIDIDIAKKQKSAIAAQLQQQTAQMGPQLDQIEQQLYEANETIILKKDELKQRRNQLEDVRGQFENVEAIPENEELRTQLLEEIDALKNAISTLRTEIDQLDTQRTQLSQQRDGLLSQRSAAQAQASSAGKQADAAIRDQKKAMNQIGKTMQENILKQYLKERANTNLMEQMDSYMDDTRGSLQRFFELFEDGKTNSEVKMYFSQKGIEIPESYIKNVKKHFESYKDLKLKLGFLEQEARDFKKEIDPTQHEQKKQLTTKLFKK